MSVCFLLATIKKIFFGMLKVKSSVMSDSLRPHGLQPTRLLCPWAFPGKSSGVGYHFLLQGIFPTQGSNLSLLHCRQMLYPLSHQGSPTNTSVFPPSSLSYRFLCGSMYSFLLVRSSCLFSAGVLHALLCLKVCS